MCIMKKQFLFIATLIISLFISQNVYSTIHTVSTVGNTGFLPSNLSINIGDTVNFINAGGFHNINATLATFPNNPEGFGNTAASNSWTFQWIFNVAGTYDYQCDPHAPGMSGVINVNTPTLLGYTLNDPLCNGGLGELIINLNQTVPPTDVTIKIFNINQFGNWGLVATSFGANNVFPPFPLVSAIYKVELSITSSAVIFDTIPNFSIVDPDLFLAYINSTSPILCNGGTGDLEITTTGGTTPLNLSYFWSDGTSASFTSGFSGNYNCLVNDGNGCEDSAYYNLLQPDMLQASGFVSQNIIGSGNANGEITAQVTGGIPPYNYSINNGIFTSDSIFQNLLASNHLIAYQDSNNCIISEIIVLNNPGLLSGFATISSPVTCYGECDGSIEFVNNNSGISPYTFTLNGGVAQSSNIFNDLCGDSIYYVLIMDSVNSSFVDTIYLGQPDPLLFSVSSTDTANFNGYNIACNGGVGSIYMCNPIGGNGAPISYSFDGGDSFIEFCTQGDLQAGNYTLVIEDALGCRAYDSTALTEPLPITISPQVNDVSCNSFSDGSINIIASEGVLPFSYSWNDGQVTQQIVGLSVDTFSCVLTDANGCNADTSVIISEPDVLLVISTITDNLIPFSNLAAINTNISGGTATFTATWIGPNNFSSTDLNIDSLFSGIYYLNVIDTNSCNFLDTIEIIDPIAIFGCIDPLALNYDSNANVENGMCYYCNLDYTLYSGPPSSQFNCDGWLSVYIPYGQYTVNYYWSTSAPTTDFSILNLCNDYYSLTIVDDNGCGADTIILLSNYIGCMDPLALNYDPSAMFDDNSCIPFIYGCTDSTMSNFNSLANTDDGLCVPYIYGCMDILAINYNPLSDTSNGTCCFIAGCMDDTMFNYNITACIDTAFGGSCVPYIYGCMDYLAANYYPFANTDDGSCWYCNDGCMDSSMFNYDSLATCNYDCIPYIYGCVDSLAFNYDSLANTDDNSCITVVVGCTDSTMFNYDPLANIDDASCFSCSFSTPIWLIDTVNIFSCGAFASINVTSTNSGSLAYDWDVLWGSFCCNPTMPMSENLCLGI